MVTKISVVINTLNEEKDIEKAIKSVNWADEIVVCDMYSEDKTAAIAKKLGAKVFLCKKEMYVEPVRNFAISKATNDWVLILDADEIIPDSLANRLQEIASKTKEIDYVRLPRRNMIFDHFMQATGWWPDYNVRFFKKGSVKWGNKIHRPPETTGEGLDLPVDDDKYAIIHDSYSSISQFLERMNRYTTIEAEDLMKEGYRFHWPDLFKKPLNEFLSRYFANKGYDDGLHGLVLSFLQAFSFMVVYLKLWEKEKFKEQKIESKEINNQLNESGNAIKYWVKKMNSPKDFFKRFLKIK